MPLYEFRCGCGHGWLRLERNMETAHCEHAPCPNCGGEGRRVFARSNVVWMRGRTWYRKLLVDSDAHRHKPGTDYTGLAT